MGEGQGEALQREGKRKRGFPSQDQNRSRAIRGV